MKGGGFVIGDRTVTLADIRCPLLYFVGTRDEIARPASVRAIRTEAPGADLHELSVRAGHFGLVVGSTSLRVSWPTVVEWMRWVDGDGPMPARLAEQQPEPIEDVEEAAFDDIELRAEEIYDVATSAIEQLWGRVGTKSRELGAWMDVVRWQLPRLAKLQRLDDGVEVSLGRALSEQAAAIPDAVLPLARPCVQLRTGERPRGRRRAWPVALRRARRPRRRDDGQPPQLPLGGRRLEPPWRRRLPD